MKTLGILRETKNKWEARVPLNPEAVKKLIKQDFKVKIQPSNIRIYKDKEYIEAGALISDDLSECDLILGVKEIRLEEIVPGIPHLFFSHTVKGQDYNMPILQKFLDMKATLLDYELIKNTKDRRLVFFGKYAGNAGMVDTLWGLGQRLKKQYNLDTPFLKLKQSYQYKSIKDALEHLKMVGKEIEQNGLPDRITPLNIFLLGYGHVAYGCQEILKTLPIVNIDPDELKNHQKNYENNKVYLSVFKEKHLAERKDGSKFNLQHFFNDCSEYNSKFEKYLPFCSVYMNAIYWNPDCPVYLKKSELAKIQGKDQKLIIIGDISSDINGSVQATVKYTTPDNPVYIYNAKTGEIADDFIGEGFADMVVDNLPCEFPRESSDNFSHALLPLMDKMLTADYNKPIRESGLPDEIKKACITHHGKLEPDFEYLYGYLATKTQIHKEKLNLPNG